MEWTPEAVNAEIAYRRGDAITRQHLREVRQTRRPRWWQRLRVHRSDGNGEHRAA
ncbi:hypothetical protein [Kibdelosporangium aridum]|uniref:Uncharacterized protein n=1 Tax=Kibdelosporangium aridum TaxID=2030 RepID=A0A1W2EK26_KIBAR|nr:hypothetical protein [Kibdelosporangium aridum]SMD09965.1 hypothetical protein SAMN05661093_04545 [Kibdelosporangium aridum]